MDLLTEAERLLEQAKRVPPPGADLTIGKTVEAAGVYTLIDIAESLRKLADQGRADHG